MNREHDSPATWGDIKGVGSDCDRRHKRTNRELGVVRDAAAEDHDKITHVFGSGQPPTSLAQLIQKNQAQDARIGKLETTVNTLQMKIIGASLGGGSAVGGVAALLWYLFGGQ